MPASSRDPEILREIIKGTFSFGQEDGSPWTSVFYKPSEDPQVDQEGEDEDEEEERLEQVNF
jgi:hypothetical protein